MKRLIIAAAAALALSACATETLYQAATKHTDGNGYSDQRIESDRWRVTFSGNYVTSRQTVESYMLYRAAELTLENGFDWFETVDRSTQSMAYCYDWGGPYDGWWGGYAGGWSPSWNCYGDSWTDTGMAYQVQANILVHHGPRPRDNAHAFDAHEVAANLGPHIQRPLPDRQSASAAQGAIAGRTEDKLRVSGSAVPGALYP